VPGIQPSDVTELLEHGATVVVLTKGVYERLRVCPETLKLLSDRGIAVHVLQTEEAVRAYNRLVETDRVGGLFHSTCWPERALRFCHYDAGGRFQRSPLIVDEKDIDTLAKSQRLHTILARLGTTIRAATPARRPVNSGG
jgi:hypothetical protein